MLTFLVCHTKYSHIQRYKLSLPHTNGARLSEQEFLAGGKMSSPDRRPLRMLQRFLPGARRPGFGSELP